jgi:hypothetical protein
VVGAADVKYPPALAEAQEYFVSLVHDGASDEGVNEEIRIRQLCLRCSYCDC